MQQFDKDFIVWLKKMSEEDFKDFMDNLCQDLGLTDQDEKIEARMFYDLVRKS